MTESPTTLAAGTAANAVGSAPDSTEPPVAQHASATPRRRAMAYLEAYALLGLLVLVAVVFSVLPSTSDAFLTSANIRVLVAGQAVVAVVALASLIPMCAGEWDLSVGAIAGLAAVFGASVMSGGSLVAGIAVALGVGILVGIANAVIVTRFKVHAVIATLGMATVLAGIINQKTNGLSVVSDIPQVLLDLGSGTWLGIPRIGVVLVVVALCTHYVLEHTPYGRYLYALGANPTAARLVGLRTRTVLASAFVLAGSLAAIGGILAIARAGGADPRVGDQLLLPAFAAAFLSAASIKPGRYNVGGLLVAVYFLAVLNNGLNLAGVKPYVNSYVNGVALIIGVGLAGYLGRKRRGKQ
jgi:ribose transport system permease protein